MASRDDEYPYYQYVRPGEVYLLYWALMPNPSCDWVNRTSLPYRYDLATNTLTPTSGFPGSLGGPITDHYSPYMYNGEVHVGEFAVCVPSVRPGYLDDCLPVGSSERIVGWQPAVNREAFLVLVKDWGSETYRVWRPFAPGGPTYLGNPITLTPDPRVEGVTLVYPWLVMSVWDDVGEDATGAFVLYNFPGRVKSYV
ncbi:hypothetical protein [Thermus arciformis]|uniref:hypothetical protein n=1 Tax=Thermus arciformis TaxID=482827 RepID=UPI001F4B9CFE|nr:hypothetical protein [Thermus arciformis]